MHDIIQSKLTALEQDYGVRVLYALESGSRAWGFASHDSDWDVRFIYVHPRDWYLSVHEQRDVIELPIEGDLDINGWDLRKTLRLMAKSNPVLQEWLHSPIVYRQDDDFIARLRELSGAFYSQTACFHHYLSMAKGNFREYLQGEQVRAKKYFYVLRPIFACRWIETRNGAPPILFDSLVEAVSPPELKPEIAELLVRKMAGDELDAGPANPALHAFITAELKRLASVGSGFIRQAPDRRLLDAFLRQQISAG